MRRPPGLRHGVTWGVTVLQRVSDLQDKQGPASRCQVGTEEGAGSRSAGKAPGAQAHRVARTLTAHGGTAGRVGVYLVGVYLGCMRDV